jgi:hypothetical protein
VAVWSTPLAMSGKGAERFIAASSFRVIGRSVSLELAKTVQATMAGD